MLAYDVGSQGQWVHTSSLIVIIRSWIEAGAHTPSRPGTPSSRWILLHVLCWPGSVQTILATCEFSLRVSGKSKISIPMRLTDTSSCKATSARIIDLSSSYPSDNRISPILAQQAYCRTNMEHFRNCLSRHHTCDDNIVYVCFKGVKAEGNIFQQVKTQSKLCHPCLYRCYRSILWYRDNLVVVGQCRTRTDIIGSVPSWSQRPVQWPLSYLCIRVDI